MQYKQLTLLAIKSRIFIIVLQFFSNIFVKDHNAQVFQYLRTKAQENSISSFINFTIGGFIRWDAEYFMHIAKYGYTYENSLAFFPLYPFLVQSLKDILNFFIPVLNGDTLLLLVFILFNFVIFILSAQILYKLTLLILDESVASKTAMLFCVNPASIFFSAPYTECLFSYLTFQSIYHSVSLLRKYSKPDHSFSLKDTTVLLFISLSTLVRSNGILNIGFILYVILCKFVTYFPKNNVAKFVHILKYLCTIIFCCILCSLPFILYQIYCFRKFCNTYKADLPTEIVNFAVEQNFILPGEFAIFNQSWCYKKIPLAYLYVQDHYWDVGFLRYYKFKQIPNFLLAIPCLYIIFKNCLLHVSINFRKLDHIFNLKELVTYSNKKEHFSEKQFFKLGLTAFVIHGLFLSIFCALCTHIQVSTRMICSATPLFYWYCAYYCSSNKNVFIKIYFGSYVIIGTVMFCNFLPWT